MERPIKFIYLGHRTNYSPGFTVFNPTLNKVEYTRDLVFDQNSILQFGTRPVTAPRMLDVATVRRHLDDFEWLVGMCYQGTLQYNDIIKMVNPEPWFDTAKDEVMSLLVEKNVFESCDLPPGFKALETKWVFKRKQSPDKIWKYKARLVKKGFQHRL